MGWEKQTEEESASVLAVFRILFICTAWTPSISRFDTAGVLSVLAVIWEDTADIASILGLCASDNVGIMGSTLFGRQCFHTNEVHTPNTPSILRTLWSWLRWASEIFSAGNTAWRHSEYSVLTVRVRYCSYCEHWQYVIVQHCHHCECCLLYTSPSPRD